ncbi:MAG: tetratricopeptide repeat protein [Verrucomicrobia bacterium]|jgi:tetratricopeptide (TPR) repeat protein|nr:tetratricopeptide repeat protein [Verrucomicrobiota bacterium]
MNPLYAFHRLIDFCSQRRAASLLIVFLAWVSSPLQADDFSAGLEAYEAGHYAKATESFQRSLDQEETAALRHNLALSLYQQGRPAEAVWQLERAIRLQPFNQNYHLKLGILRQQMGLYQNSSPWWLSAAQILSFGTWVWIASLSFWVLLAAFALPKFAGRRSRLATQLTVWLSAILMLLSLTALILQKSNEITGTILAETPIALRHAPASAAPEAGQARPGERVRQIDQHQNFLKIKTEAGITGWVHSDALKKL